MAIYYTSTNCKKLVTKKSAKQSNKGVKRSQIHGVGALSFTSHDFSKSIQAFIKIHIPAE